MPRPCYRALYKNAQRLGFANLLIAERSLAA